MAKNTDIYNNVLRSYYDTSYLCHYGIKGQKWGIRNYQNSDGTLTSAGKERYRSNAHIYKPRSKDTMQREIASGKIVTVSGGGGEQYYEVEDWEKENLQMEDDIRKYEAIAEDENATPEEREDALRKANILRRNLELKRKAEQAFLSEWVSSQEVWRSLGHGNTMNYNDILKSYYDTSFLCHHGILGMKWGIRRYQNKDGTLTAAGRKRYGYREDARNSLKNNLNSILDSDVAKKYNLHGDVHNFGLTNKDANDDWYNECSVYGSLDSNYPFELYFSYDQRIESPADFTKRVDKTIQIVKKERQNLASAAADGAYEAASKARDSIKEIRDEYPNMPSKDEYRKKMRYWGISSHVDKRTKEIRTLVQFLDDTGILWNDTISVEIDENGKSKGVRIDH